MHTAIHVFKEKRVKAVTPIVKPPQKCLQPILITNLQRNTINVRGNLYREIRLSNRGPVFAKKSSLRVVIVNEVPPLSPSGPMLKLVDATTDVVREGYFFSHVHRAPPTMHSTLDMGGRGYLSLKP